MSLLVIYFKIQQRKIMMSTDSSENLQHGVNANDSEAWKEFDILAAVVSRFQAVNPTPSTHSPEHRISCHRCGNIRKRRILCQRTVCPHTFCGRCSDKMKEEYGINVFAGGCPVCKELCCCSNKTVFCHRKNHCYRKCPATKASGRSVNGLDKMEKNGVDEENAPFCGFVGDGREKKSGHQQQFGMFNMLPNYGGNSDKGDGSKKRNNSINGGSSIGDDYNPVKKTKIGTNNSQNSLGLKNNLGFMNNFAGNRNSSDQFNQDRSTGFKVPSMSNFSNNYSSGSLLHQNPNQWDNSQFDPNLANFLSNHNIVVNKNNQAMPKNPENSIKKSKNVKRPDNVFLSNEDANRKTKNPMDLLALVSSYNYDIETEKESLKDKIEKNDTNNKNINS